MISPWRRGDRDRRRQGAGAARDAAAVGEGQGVWTAEDGIVAGGGRGQTRGRENEGPHQVGDLIEEDLDQEVLTEKEEVIIEVVGDVIEIGIMTGEETEKRRQGTMKNKSRKLVRWGWRFQST